MINGYDIVPKLFIFAKSNIYELCQASGGPRAPDYQLTEELPIRQLTCNMHLSYHSKNKCR